MALALKSSCFLQLKKPEVGFHVCFSSKKALISVKRYTPVAAMRTMEVPGLSETFTRLRKEGKVSSYFSSCMGSMLAMFTIVSHFNMIAFSIPFQILFICLIIKIGWCWYW